jgi:hypothetical protein
VCVQRIALDDHFRAPFERFDVIYGGNGETSELTPERNAIGYTHGSASSEHARDPIASSSANFCRKRTLYPAPQLDAWWLLWAVGC